MSLDRPQTRSLMFLRIEGLGGKRSATSIDSDGIIDPTSFQRDEASDGDFAGALIYRPNVAEQQRIREAGLTDGPKLFQTGALWADVADLDYELYYLIHPYVVNDCIRRALHELYAEVSVPLTIWPDGDLSSPGILSWNNGTIIAPTKSSAYKSISNQRSLVVASSAGNLYAESETVYVEPGDHLFHGAIGAVEGSSSGEAYYALINKTTGDAIYENRFESHRDQIIRHQDVIPAGCTKIAIRVGATENGVTTVWKGFPSHMIGAGTSQTQSWLREAKNFLGLAEGSYGRVTGTDRANFTDRTLTTWPNVDYRLMPFVSASDFYKLQINRSGGLGAVDYWIHGYRKMNEIEEELDDELAETNFDNEDMFLTAVETLICEALGPEYADQAARGRAMLDVQRIARAVVQPTPELGMQRVGLRR